MKTSKTQPQKLHPQLQKLDRKLKKAAQMYEQQFLRQMVKAMRNSVSHSALTKPGMAESIYREQMDDHNVQAWVERGGTGFADMIYNDLVEKFYPQLAQQAPQPVRPVNITDRFQGITKSRGSTDNRAHSFNIELSASPKSKSYLQLPLSGRVNNVFELDSGQSVAQVSHDQGMKSTFVFSGKVPPGLLNKDLRQGENFALLGPESQSLTWKIQHADSRKDSSGEEKTSFN